MKVLVAEDNDQVRHLIVRLLESALTDYELTECSDGVDAVSCSSLVHPDLILMDIMMDRMDGISAARKIHKELPEAKILIVSQLPEEEFKDESLKAGAVDYLNKDHLYELPEKIRLIMK